MKYFETKLTYNKITFDFSNSPSPDEREIHSYHEILYYIGGEAELLTEKTQIKLTPNSLLLIPKEKYHFIRLDQSGFFTRIKIGVPHELIKEIGFNSMFLEISICENINETVLYLLNRLHQILTQTQTEKTPFYAYNVFMMLLSEIDITGVFKEGQIESAEESFLPEIISYISQNLSYDLSIETLAKKLNLSASTLTHSFKKELGISLHEYITQRRLMLAKKLISKNQKPSKIYFDCGFKDYSSFYKAYVKHFGYPPSKEK
ncbi:MAG: helix-turn-helix transcriptional regulator [Clostridia bacterium]|nr:helix-turn-helix transcriptional regulator [Clostridia bacterium]